MSLSIHHLQRRRLQLQLILQLVLMVATVHLERPPKDTITQDQHTTMVHGPTISVRDTSPLASKAPLHLTDKLLLATFLPGPTVKAARCQDVVEI